MNSMLKEGLSVVIPIYNEKGNIQLLFKKIISFKKNSDINFEFILVDGFSQDGTQELIKKSIELNSLHQYVKLYSMKTRNGYGYDIMFGLQNANYDSLAWTHADLQTDLNDVLKGYKILKQSPANSIIKGRRVGRNFVDSSLTFAMQIFAFIKTGINLSDINAQPKIFSRQLYETSLIKNAPNDFSLDLFLLINAVKFKSNIITFDVKFKDRQYGEAKGGGGSLANRIALIKRTIKYINNVKKT